MQPYSVDLRTRVLAALDQGLSRTEVVRIFQVSLASVKRWLKVHRETGQLTPRPARGGSAPTITPTHEQQLRAQVQAAPDATLAEHAVQWNATHGTSLSASTIGRAIRGLGVTRKKRR